MGDLQSELNELFWLNLFYSSIEGTPDIQESPCFRTLGYDCYIFLRFKILKIINEIQKSVQVSPDFLLWNKEKNLFY